MSAYLRHVRDSWRLRIHHPLEHQLGDSRRSSRYSKSAIRRTCMHRLRTIDSTGGATI